MNHPEYSMAHICSRYEEITGDKIVISNPNINLSGLLWDAYGDDYAPHPRLPKICELNNIRLNGFHNNPENYNTARAKELAISSKVAAFEKIYCAYKSGKLRHYATVTKPQPKPEISISTLAVQPLINALSPYVEKVHLTALVKILGNQDIDVVYPIAVCHQQNSLVYLFRQVKDKAYINVAATKLRDWLCYYFVIVENGNAKPLNPGVVYEDLTKDRKPAKERRIKIEL